jgi:AraC family transcriptional regulator of adaptative response/methylated-DNA-[protein]-cysteine methyltransferase
MMCDTQEWWQAVKRRDRAYDGKFVFAVATTGIYCRPSCPSRRANPANIRFFTTSEQARRAGFRACLRCAPDRDGDPQADLVASACRSILESDGVPALADLAAQAGLSPSRSHRLFKSVTGRTPHQFAQSCRAQRVRNNLIQGGGPVTGAIYESGFNASSRFYDHADRTLGMSPKAFAAGGAGQDVRFAIASSDLGQVLVAASGRGVCAVFLGDGKDALEDDLRRLFPQARLADGEPGFQDIVAAVVRQVDHPDQAANLPLDLQGTLFQQRVWDALRAIPVGQTATYSQVAARLGIPAATRAVASACAANKVAVLVPCHRVVRIGGGLAGYRWGTQRKRALLEREKK